MKDKLVVEFRLEDSRPPGAPEGPPNSPKIIKKIKITKIMRFLLLFPHSGYWRWMFYVDLLSSSGGVQKTRKEIPEVVDPGAPTNLK